MVTRRGFVRGTMLAGMAALTASSVATLKALLTRAVTTAVGTVNEGFIYTSVGKTLWYQNLLGREAMAAHFPGVGYGATALWRALFDDSDKLIPGTGSPALVIKVDTASPPQSSRILYSPDVPEEFQNLSTNGFVALFNTCVHLCCNPALNLAHTVIEQPPSDENVLDHPDYTLSGLPVVAPDVGVIYCPCHHSQYDPLRFVPGVHTSGNSYIGANWVWGPAQRALPAIPVAIQGGKLVGKYDHPDWYSGYCGL